MVTIKLVDSSLFSLSKLSPHIRNINERFRPPTSGFAVGDLRAKLFQKGVCKHAEITNRKHKKYCIFFYAKCMARIRFQFVICSINWENWFKKIQPLLFGRPQKRKYSRKLNNVPHMNFINKRFIFARWTL